MTLLSATEAGIAARARSPTLALGPLDSDTLAHQVSTIQIADGIFGITSVLVLNESETDLDIAADDAAVLVEHVLEVARPAVKR